MSRDYPAHPDFDYSREIDTIRDERDKDWARQPWVAIVTSEAWSDHEQLDGFVDGLVAKYPNSTIVLPDRAVGGSKTISERVEQQGYRTVRVRSESQWGSGRQAVQASHIIRLADIVVVFHAGGTDLAKATIDKAMDVHRPMRDDFGSGLHVYEMLTKTVRKANGLNDKGKAKYSQTKQYTGKTRYRTRKDRELVAA